MTGKSSAVAKMAATPAALTPVSAARAVVAVVVAAMVARFSLGVRFRDRQAIHLHHSLVAEPAVRQTQLGRARVAGAVALGQMKAFFHQRAQVAVAELPGLEEQTIPIRIGPMSSVRPVAVAEAEAPSMPAVAAGLVAESLLFTAVAIFYLDMPGKFFPMGEMVE